MTGWRIKAVTKPEGEKTGNCQAERQLPGASISITTAATSQAESQSQRREMSKILGGAGLAGGGLMNERPQLRHSTASSLCGLPQCGQFFIPDHE
jgi:hypothetical protein